MTLRNLALTSAGLIAGFALAAGSAIAAECPRGDLDERYCDVDGDLTADTPTDPDGSSIGVKAKISVSGSISLLGSVGVSAVKSPSTSQ